MNLHFGFNTYLRNLPAGGDVFGLGELLGVVELLDHLLDLGLGLALLPLARASGELFDGVFVFGDVVGAV